MIGSIRQRWGGFRVAPVELRPQASSSSPQILWLSRIEAVEEHLWTVKGQSPSGIPELFFGPRSTFPGNVTTRHNVWTDFADSKRKKYR